MTFCILGVRGFDSCFTVEELRMGRKYAKNETEKRDKEENKCNEKRGNSTLYNEQILLNSYVFFLQTNMAKTVKYSRFPFQGCISCMYGKILFFPILFGWKR